MVFYNILFERNCKLEIGLKIRKVCRVRTSFLYPCNYYIILERCLNNNNEKRRMHSVMYDFRQDNEGKHILTKSNCTDFLQ